MANRGRATIVRLKLEGVWSLLPRRDVWPWTHQSVRLKCRVGQASLPNYLSVFYGSPWAVYEVHLRPRVVCFPPRGHLLPSNVNYTSPRRAALPVDDHFLTPQQAQRSLRNVIISIEEKARNFPAKVINAAANYVLQSREEDMKII